MDDQVLAAMARWPNVPAMYGWLRLDARGNWHLIQRDLPNFDETLHGKGSPITNPAIVEFIWRNYSRDDQGNYYWQNGPQRVFVSLERGPRVVRLAQSDTLHLFDTVGTAVQEIRRALLGDDGAVYLDTEIGPVSVDDRHLDRLAAHIQETSGGMLLGALPLTLHRNPAQVLGFNQHPGVA
jgi:Protein of unknown function (DUF2946)